MKKYIVAIVAISAFALIGTTALASASNFGGYSMASETPSDSHDGRMGMNEEMHQHQWHEEGYEAEYGSQHSYNYEYNYNYSHENNNYHDLEGEHYHHC